MNRDWDQKGYGLTWAVTPASDEWAVDIQRRSGSWNGCRGPLPWDVGLRERQGVRLPKTLVKEDKLSKPQAMMKRKTGASEWGACQHQPALLGWRRLWKLGRGSCGVIPEVFST